MEKVVCVRGESLEIVSLKISEPTGDGGHNGFTSGHRLWVSCSRCEQCCVVQCGFCQSVYVVRSSVFETSLCRVLLPLRTVTPGRNVQHKTLSLSQILKHLLVSSCRLGVLQLPVLFGHTDTTTTNGDSQHGWQLTWLLCMGKLGAGPIIESQLC